MITIRTGVFETNSSSTHSITFAKLTNSENINDPLIVDNILYPSRLSQMVDFNNYYMTLIICNTFEKKLAMVANLLLHTKEHYYDNYVLGIDRLINEFELKDIVFEDSYSRFYDEEGDIFMELTSFYDDLSEMINRIKDPNEMIMHSIVCN